MEPDKKPQSFVDIAVFKKKTKNYLPGLHRDLPLCDAQFGRPTLDMRKCYHHGCEKTFLTGAALSNHLSLNGCYTKGWVKQHIQKYPIGTKIAFSCQVCKLNFKSTEEMVAHLARLGIEGYWKKGQTYRDLVESIRKDKACQLDLVFGKGKAPPANTFPTQQFTDVIETQNCIICEQLPPEVLYITCRHMNVCFRCYKLLQNREICIYCKTSTTQMFKLTPEALAIMMS